MTSESKFRRTRCCHVKFSARDVALVDEWENAVETRDSRNSRRDNNILFSSSPRSDCRHSVPFSSLAGRGLGHDIISPRLIRSAPNSARFPPLDPDSPQRQHGLPMRSSREVTNGNRESPFPDPAGHRGARQLHPSTPHGRENPHCPSPRNRLGGGDPENRHPTSSCSAVCFDSPFPLVPLFLGDGEKIGVAAR